MTSALAATITLAWWHLPLAMFAAGACAYIFAYDRAYDRGFLAGVDAVNAAARDEHAAGFSAVEETS